MYPHPNQWYVAESSLEDFVLGMIGLGTPIEIALVGVFDTEGRGSRRDIELPPHRDGEYSKKLAEAQGGTYVEKPGIDIVGLYCIREGGLPCSTTLWSGATLLQEIELKRGQALVFDNTKLLHGRKGPVGSRLLLRAWLSSAPSVPPSADAARRK